MALDGIPFDLPHPFRDVYVLDENVTVALDIDVQATDELLNNRTGVVITRPPAVGGPRTVPGASPRLRVLRSGRRVVRSE